MGLLTKIPWLYACGYITSPVEDDFHAFRVTIRANPQVDVQVTLSEPLHSTTTVVDLGEPPSKKRKKKQSIAPTPTHNANAAFSTSSIPSVPPSKSTSPATTTSPLSTFPSISAPFTISTFPPVAPVRNLLPATGVLGPTPKGSGKDKKDKVKDKDGEEDTGEEEDEEKQEKKKKKKEKPKRFRRKTEAAPASMSPACMWCFWFSC
jgi:hypothetical protein